MAAQRLYSFNKLKNFVRQKQRFNTAPIGAHTSWLTDLVVALVLVPEQEVLEHVQKQFDAPPPVGVHDLGQTGKQQLSIQVLELGQVEQRLLAHEHRHASVSVAGLCGDRL